MKSVTEMLQDADPLRVEQVSEQDRDRMRRAVLTGASRATEPSSTSRSTVRARAVLLTAIAVGLIAIAVLGSRNWSGGSATLHAAAVRLEVRLAEVAPTLGLSPVRGSPFSSTVL